MIRFDAAALLGAVYDAAEVIGYPVSADAVSAVMARGVQIAYDKNPGTHPGARAVVDTAAGTIVVRTETGQDVTPTALERTAPPLVRQEVVAFIRDLSRRKAVGAWANREGSAVTFVPSRLVDRGWAGAVDGVAALLPTGEFAAESLTAGTGLAVLLLAANVDDRDRIRLTVSRRQPVLLEQLMLTYCPALSSGLVHVVAIARDAGVRSKVALAADDGLDPLAATVGPAGAHMRAVVAALGAERIDLVAYDPDPLVYVAAALTPGKVLSASHPAGLARAVEVVVAPAQVAAVCGSQKANLRLAQRLTGAKISYVVAT